MRKAFPVIAILLAVACASADTYQMASQTYAAESLVYAQARDSVKAQHDLTGITAEQWTRWQAIRAEVQAADTAYYSDLVAWRSTGVKPVTLDSNAATLRAAQSRMSALASEVK